MYIVSDKVAKEVVAVLIETKTTQHPKFSHAVAQVTSLVPLPYSLLMGAVHLIIVFYLYRYFDTAYTSERRRPPVVLLLDTYFIFCKPAWGGPSRKCATTRDTYLGFSR